MLRARVRRGWKRKVHAAAKTADREHQYLALIAFIVYSIITATINNTVCCHLQTCR